MMFLRSSILRYAQLSLAAVSVLLPFAVDAFVGHHRNVLNSHVAFQRTRRNTGPESLSMNLFDRFSRVAKANLDSVLQKIEDPEKVMTQAVEDMQKDLVKVRQNYAEVTASQRRLAKQRDQANVLADEWRGRAQLALEKNNDELAREALTRRQQQVDVVADLQSQIDNQNTGIDSLYEGMQTLESKIMEAKAKKDQLAARARTAQSTQKVNDMLSGMTGDTSMDAFKRMEEKVESLEAGAEISKEMADSQAMLTGGGGGSLEKEFQALEGGRAVDDELEKMKMLLSGSDNKSSGSAGGAGDVDDEFERLKKEAGL